MARRPTGPGMAGPGRRGSRIIAAVVAVAATLAAWGAWASGCFAPGAAAVADRVAAVSPEGEVALDSGRRLRLMDLRLADDRFPEAAGAARRWLASLAGHAVAVSAASAEPDRWGRVPAALSLSGTSGGAVDVAELLVGEGWALADPGERDALCRPELLAAERRAEAARAGLWRTGLLPLAAAAPDPVRREAGRFVVVEGRVRSVGERRDRTYLNFGRDFSRDLAVVVPRRLWAELKRTGISAEALRGRVVRVRGQVEIRRSPVIELGSAEMLEWRDAGPATGR